MHKLFSPLLRTKPSLISLMVSVDVKHHVYLLKNESRTIPPPHLNLEQVLWLFLCVCFAYCQELYFVTFCSLGSFNHIWRNRGNFWETGWSTYGLFRAHRYHLELYSPRLYIFLPAILKYIKWLASKTMNLTDRLLVFNAQSAVTAVWGCWPKCDTRGWLGVRKENRSGIEPKSFRLLAYRLTTRPNRLSKL